MLGHFSVVQGSPKMVELEDKKRRKIDVFGIIEEITSRAGGAEKASFAKITLWTADKLHFHKIAEETYICMEGEGQIFLDGKIIDFNPGVRVIIEPDTLHAARPVKGELVFYCVSSPPFDEKDVYYDRRGRKW